MSYLIQTEAFIALRQISPLAQIFVESQKKQIFMALRGFFYRVNGRNKKCIQVYYFLKEKQNYRIIIVEYAQATEYI